MIRCKVYLFIPFCISWIISKTKKIFLIFFSNRLYKSLDSGGRCLRVVSNRRWKKGDEKRKRTANLRTENNMGGLICSCTSSKKMRRFRLCPEDFSLSTSISPAVLATFSILPVRKCTHNMNTFRMAWLSWLRAKVSSQMHQRHLPMEPHRRP